MRVKQVMGLAHGFLNDALQFPFYCIRLRVYSLYDRLETGTEYKQLIWIWNVAHALEWTYSRCYCFGLNSERCF